LQTRALEQDGRPGGQDPGAKPSEKLPAADGQETKGEATIELALKPEAAVQMGTMPGPAIARPRKEEGERPSPGDDRHTLHPETNKKSSGQETGIPNLNSKEGNLESKRLDSTRNRVALYVCKQARQIPEI
jgi:hypothetical protein